MKIVFLKIRKIDDNSENLSSNKLSKNDHLLLNGDEIYLEKMNDKKKRKKVRSNSSHNIFDGLSI